MSPVRVDSHAAVRAAPIFDGDGHSDTSEARWSRARATREIEIWGNVEEAESSMGKGWAGASGGENCSSSTGSRRAAGLWGDTRFETETTRRRSSTISASESDLGRWRSARHSDDRRRDVGPQQRERGAHRPGRKACSRLGMSNRMGRSLHFGAPSQGEHRSQS